MTDYYYVDCEDYREALSARLDSEDGPDDAEQPADVHLEQCVECALWYDQAALITRRTRTTSAVAWPDVTDAVLARVPPRSGPRLTKLRMALGVVGAVQGASALVTLAAGSAGQAAAGYENGAWNLALGVAFSAVAARRTPPAALIPLLATFVAALSWGYVTDLLSGAPSPSGVLSHLLAMVGLVLVVLLSRMPPIRRGPTPPVTAAGRIRRPEPPVESVDEIRMTIRSVQSRKSA